MKHKIIKQITSIKEHYFTHHFILILAVVLSFIYAEGAPAQKILRQIGFEDYDVGNKDDVFQASTDTVKVGKKSLTIFSDKKNELHLSSQPLETDNSIVSVEFWGLY